MANDLIVVEKIKKEVLFTEPGILDAVLEGIKSKIDEFEPDTTTTAGRKEIASMSRKVSSSKTFLDGIRKEKIATAKQEIDSANGLWKPAREQLDEWRDDVRKPLTDWEAEQERIDQERIAAARKLTDAINDSYWSLNGTGTVEQLNAVIAQLEALEITPDVYFEFTADAYEIRDKVLIQAKADLETKIRLAAEQKQREEEAERLAAERKKQEEEAARLKKVADEQAATLKKQQDIIDENERKLKAERDTLEAEKRAEQERKDREEFERQAKIEAEEKAAWEAKEKAARELREKEEAATEAERQKALLPDKEKLVAFSQFLLEGVNYPEVESAKAKEVLKIAKDYIDSVGETVFEEAEKL